MVIFSNTDKQPMIHLIEEMTQTGKRIFAKEERKDSYWIFTNAG